MTMTTAPQSRNAYLLAALITVAAMLFSLYLPKPRNEN